MKLIFHWIINICWKWSFNARIPQLPEQENKHWCYLSQNSDEQHSVLNTEGSFTCAGLTVHDHWYFYALLNCILQWALHHGSEVARNINMWTMECFSVTKLKGLSPGAGCFQRCCWQQQLSLNLTAGVTPSSWSHMNTTKTQMRFSVQLSLSPQAKTSKRKQTPTNQTKPNQSTAQVQRFIWNR